MATRYDYTIDQGASLGISIECQDSDGVAINLEGYSAASHIRKVRSDTSPSAIFTPTIYAALGIVSLSLTAGQTAALAVGKSYWDVELTHPSGTVQRLVEGVVRVSPEVTK